MKNVINKAVEKQLLYKYENLVSADDLISKSGLILYYFTSMDCHPCRLFDQKLKEVYSEAVSRDLDILIVVVSTDDDKNDMMEGLKKNYPSWYAIPFEDELRAILRYNYGVTHIPHLIVVRKNGEIVTKKGRAEIENIEDRVSVIISPRGSPQEGASRVPPTKNLSVKGYICKPS